MTQSTKTLFEDINRTNENPAPEDPHYFNFINRSANPIARNARNFLEDCFSNYPKSEKLKLKKRIKNKEKESSAEALFELILHQLLLKMNCKVEVHPKLKTTNTSPDFLVTTSKNNKFYLEATFAYENDRDAHKKEQQEKKLKDYINEKFSTNENYQIELIIVKVSSKTLSKKKLIQNIEGMINSLLKDKEQQSEWTYADNGWKIHFTLQSVPGYKGIIVVERGIVRIVETASAIIHSFKKKKSRYGVPEYPYVLAINVIPKKFSLLTKELEREALVGEYNRLPTEKDYKHIRSCWIGPKGPQNTRVSAVWLFDKINPCNLSERHIIYLNPFSKRPLTNDFYRQLPYSEVKNDIFTENKGIKPLEILNLPKFDL